MGNKIISQKPAFKSPSHDFVGNDFVKILRVS